MFTHLITSTLLLPEMFWVIILSHAAGGVEKSILTNFQTCKKISLKIIKKIGWPGRIRVKELK